LPAKSLPNCHKLPSYSGLYFHDEDGGQVEVLMVMVMTVLTCEAGGSSPGVNGLFTLRN